jgi:hypothetical protein
MRPLEFVAPFQLTDVESGVNRRQFPTLYRIRQTLPRIAEPDVPGAVRREIAPFLARIAAGQRIAVTAGSRGIARLPEVTREVVRALAGAGARPFIVPAMGSHGGATAEGQKTLLASLGISESAMGCPVVSSMEVVQLGTTSHGYPVYMDQNATEADSIFVINRVKAHTIISGPVESGICKMLVIGLGKQSGADRIHKQALHISLGEMVLEASRVIVGSSRVRLLGALALVENAYKELARVKGLALDDHARLVREESALLAEATRLLPRIPFDELDVLIVEEIGKNVSGTGMDTNVIGRKDGVAKPRIGAIYVRGLTEETHGNAHGIGMADVIPRRLLPYFDLNAMYMNAYTSRRVAQSKIPLLTETDLQALQVCMGFREDERPERARLVWIRDTSRLEELLVSQALLPEVEATPSLERLPGEVPMEFDEEDHLSSPWA